MNRTKGFINQNRFKSGRPLKRLYKTIYDKSKKVGEESSRSKGQPK